MTVSWCFQDQADAGSEAALEALADGEALVPSIWPLEIANVLVVAERRRRLNRTDAERFVELLGALPIEVEEVSFQSATGTVMARAREFGLSAYDAAYLDLAVRTGLPLSTRDATLQAACRKARVPLFL